MKHTVSKEREQAAEEARGSSRIDVLQEMMVLTISLLCFQNKSEKTHITKQLE